MIDTRPSPLAARPADTAADPRVQPLRQLGSRAHQLRAATRAADHFIALPAGDDRDTGSWLMSCAVGLAGDIATDLDGLARSLRESPAEPGFTQAVQALRVRAHQLHAAARAADHFLDQEASEDRETGSWLIACARGLADKLAAEIDDGARPPRRAADAGVVDAADAALVRRVGVRGAA